MMNIEQARANMIEQQIRTWDVLAQDVLDLLAVVRREDFVPEAYRSLAFVDMEIPLLVDGSESGETMLQPKFEARILQELAVRRDDAVLEIGAGSGYMAALLAHKAGHVVSVEIHPALKLLAERNLARANVKNVRVQGGDGAQGWPSAGPVDVLLVSASLPFIPQPMLLQLRIGGRLAAVVGDAPAMSAEIVKRTGTESWETIKLFETNIKPLVNAPHRSRFSF